MKNNMNNFKSGFVSIIGEPNVGKSTLLNAIIGEKIAITSKKKQTTRKNMKGIYTDDNSQIIFVDTPGIHKVKNKLDDYMDLSIKKSIDGIDLIIYLIDIKNINIDNIENDFNFIKKNELTKLLVINKIDLYEKEEEAENIVYDIINKNNIKKIFNEVLFVSSLKNKNIKNLIETIKKYLPYGPNYYDKEELTDEPIKNIIAEYIRQQCLYKLDKEVPHGIAVIIDKIKQNKNIINIDATIICEKNSHKGIIIGKNGQMLKNIGTASRIYIEKFLDKKINLKLYVSVKENWRNEKTQLINFGYNKKQI